MKYFIVCVNGDKMKFGNGVQKLVILGETLEIFKIIGNHFYLYWINRSERKAMLALEDGMILICWRLETEE